MDGPPRGEGRVSVCRCTAINHHGEDTPPMLLVGTSLCEDIP